MPRACHPHALGRKHAESLACVPAEQVVIEVDLGAGQVGEVEFGFYPNAAPVTVAHTSAS